MSLKSFFECLCVRSFWFEEKSEMCVVSTYLLATIGQYKRYSLMLSRGHLKVLCLLEIMKQSFGAALEASLRFAFGTKHVFYSFHLCLDGVNHLCFKKKLPSVRWMKWGYLLNIFDGKCHMKLQMLFAQMWKFVSK